MKKKETKSGKSSWIRIVLGALFAYAVFALIGFFIFMAQGWGMVNPSEKVLAWILFPLLSLILLLYNYGILGFWLTEMDDSRNALFRIIGKVFGGLGYLLHAFPIMIFGANKKLFFNLFIALPLAAVGVVSIIFGATGTNILSLPAELSGDWSAFYYALGAFAFLNAFLAFMTKKCPNCGCLMSKISNETLSYEQEIYTQQYSRTIGTISDGNGNTADVNELYDVAQDGRVSKTAKTYTCKNCGAQKQGRTLTVHKMSRDDYRRYS